MYISLDGEAALNMSYLGSPQHLVEMVANYIRAKVSGGSTIDDSNSPIDRQRRIIGLVLFLLFIGLPAAFLLLWTYFPDLAMRLFG